jgi:hypothetical protein
MITYTIVQLINVILSTIKYIVTIRCKPFTAAVVNAVSYTVNGVIVYFITQQGILVVIGVTFLTNMIGVPIGKWIVDKLEKDRLWIYNATISCDENTIKRMKRNFKNDNIDCIYREIVHNKKYSIDIFSYNKKDSRIIKDEITKYNGKYYIVESV